MTHDYKRNGTTTLFAALNVASGASPCYSDHPEQPHYRGTGIPIRSDNRSEGQAKWGKILSNASDIL
jgi:hypothetical protein